MSHIRTYAERLAKAMPERFVVEEDSWWLHDCKRNLCIRTDGYVTGDPWAFFGPLLDEFRVPASSLIAARVRTPYRYGEPDVTWTHESRLEAAAEAVCQAAEAKAREESK